MGKMIEGILHMVGGAGDTSYASNSKFPEKVLHMAKPILEEAIGRVYTSLLPERMAVVDLGCSSGPTTLEVVSEVLDVIGKLRRSLGRQEMPEILFFLNDLPGNDFNHVFRSLGDYKRKVEEEKGNLLVPYYVVGVPGSFYGRLFPSQSVHFFNASSCLNWLSQEKAIYRTKPILETAIAEMYRRTPLPERMVVVDLGCSSGPNTFLVVSEVLGIVGDLCRRLEQKPPEIQFFLNDLPGNDFNNVFRSLERYEKKMEEEKGDLLVPHYVVGVPGSFYGRLFPCNTVHFFHSNFSLMWLSQVPQGLESEQGVPVNKGNIYIAENSPPQVVKAYQEQHRRDFSTFLKSRYVELSIGGGMVLTFLGRRNKHPANDELSYLCGLLAEALNTMVSQGIISEDKVDTFNLPIYGASMQEAKSVIEEEGSFDVEKAESFESSWDPFDDSDNVLDGKNVASTLQAVMEPLISHHFGDDTPHALFSLVADNITARHLLKDKCYYTVLVFALRRKA